MDHFTLRIHMDHFQVFSSGDATLPKALEHTVRAKIGRDAGSGRDDHGFEIPLTGGQRIGIC